MFSSSVSKGGTTSIPKYRQFIYVCVGLVGFVSAFVSVLQLAEFLSSLSLAKESVNGDSKRTGFIRGQLQNMFLLGVFWIQHSGMASSWWKSLFQNSEYACLERSIYITATGAAMQLFMRHWEPVANGPLLVLPVHESKILYAVFTLLHVWLWLLMYAGCLTMDLPEMLGIKQIYYKLCELPPPLSYKSAEVQRLYGHMRHPGAICFLLVLWLHPVITCERLILAYAGTLYMWFGFSMDRQDFAYIRDQAQKKLASLGGQ